MRWREKQTVGQGPAHGAVNTPLSAGSQRPSVKKPPALSRSLARGSAVFLYRPGAREVPYRSEPHLPLPFVYMSGPSVCPGFPGASLTFAIPHLPWELRNMHERPSFSGEAVDDLPLLTNPFPSRSLLREPWCCHSTPSPSARLHLWPTLNPCAYNTTTKAMSARHPWKMSYMLA